MEVKDNPKTMNQPKYGSIEQIWTSFKNRLTAIKTRALDSYVDLRLNSQVKVPIKPSEIRDDLKLEMRGLLKMHQYCVKQYKVTGDSNYLKSSEFWRDVDHFNFDGSIRGILRHPDNKFEKIEKCMREIPDKKPFMKSTTISNQLYDRLGNTVGITIYIKIKEMKKYCKKMYKLTKEEKFERGAYFWKTVPMSKLTGNYQKALMFGQNRFDCETINEWFEELYYGIIQL